MVNVAWWPTLGTQLTLPPRSPPLTLPLPLLGKVKINRLLEVGGQLVQRYVAVLLVSRFELIDGSLVLSNMLFTQNHV